MATNEEAGEPLEIEVQIRGLMMDPITNTPVVVLKDVTGDGVLPIWIGMYEANAIALELEKTATPRPMTHDLLRDVALGLRAEVRKVVVTELRNDTFYAMIWFDQQGEAGGGGFAAVGCICDGAALGLSDLCASRGDGSARVRRRAVEAGRRWSRCGSGWRI